MQTPTLVSYNFFVEPHRRAMQQLELDLGFFLTDVGHLNIFSISSRTKSYQSALMKAAELGVAVEALDDLAGLRIVVGTQTEVPLIERFFTRQEDSRDIKVLKKHQIERDTGYRAKHILIERSSNYQSSIFPGRVEVQIHTIFEHAFNFLSRSWSYKQPWQTLPQWSNKFTKISDLLSVIDATTAELHLELSALQSDADKAEVTPYSLQFIIRSEFDEDVNIADCVDACRMYVSLGCRNNAQLRNHFRDSRVAELYEINQVRGKASGKIGPLSGMSKYSFWSTFGTRIESPGLKELLSILSSGV
jgi:ppGpp synthetase/RelA/SpoT-type nucleotidyltranferase